MGFRCANCGGNILFDVESQSMKCQHCGSMIPPEQFEVKNSSTGEDIAEAELTLYTCSGCGAQLQGTEESQVGFCPYCGGQSLLQSSEGGKSMPERLIPFQVSKDQCADLFKKHTQKVRYLPKELKNAAHLKSFTGIYMPYYEYEVELGASHIQGTKVVKSTPKYDVVNTYSINASVSGNYCGVPYDASKYYDDEIASRILPFDMKKEKPFRPAYLSGFYADASTVSPEIYYKDAQRTASRDVVEEVGRLVHMNEGINVETAGSYVEAHTKSHHSTMFPLWFLTWRKDDRVAYAVVNGESGRVVSDLPVDMKSFTLGCAAIALIVFLLLEMFFQPTPLLTSVVSLVAAALMAGSIRSSTQTIFEKQTHANDKGWNNGKEPEPEVSQKGGIRKYWGSNVGSATVSSIFIVGCVLILSYSNMSSWDLKMISRVVAPAVIIYLLLTTMKVLNWQKSVPQKQPTIAILPVFASVILNAGIVFRSPVNDFWYYLGDIVCILILIAASAVMLQVYNIGTTRPLPRLFDREEVQ